MAAEQKMVQGTLTQPTGGVLVQVSEETAAQLGSDFEPTKAAAKKTSSSSKS